MQYYFSFKVIDQIFQDIWSNSRLFGDLSIMIKDDFAQILLII